MLRGLLPSHSNPKMSEEEFLAKDLKDMYIIDVRNPFELGGGYLECAHNIPYTEVIQLPASIPKDKIVLTYCNYGNRAGQVANLLSKAGYNAYSLGGYALFSQTLKNKCKKG